jgi:hypothetical protein
VRLWRANCGGRRDEFEGDNTCGLSDRRIYTQQQRFAKPVEAGFGDQLLPQTDNLSAQPAPKIIWFNKQI